MSKKFPDLRSDEEADAWLQSADLSEYDLSGMKKVRFELARKDASISLRLPAALLADPEGERGESQHADPAAHPHDDRSATRPKPAQGRSGSRRGKPARLLGQGNTAA